MSTHNINEEKATGIIGSAAIAIATNKLSPPSGPGNNKRKSQKSSGSTTISSSSSSNNSSSDSGMTNNEMEYGSVTRQLLQCLTRELLENLICHSIQTSTALSIQDLQTALPSDLQWKTRAITTNSISASTTYREHRGKKGKKQRRQVVEVAKGSSRVGTGFFDAIDDENMRLVLLFLPLQERIPCVTRVCKAWREFKHSLPGLWDDLTQWEKSTAYSRNYYRDRVAWLRADHLLAMLDWVPSPATITAIKLSTTKNCHPNNCKQVIKKLIELNIPPLTKLVISGPKVTPSVMEALLKTSLVGPQLTTLVITQDVKSQLADVIWRLLKVCPNLTNLTMPGNLWDGIRPATRYLGSLMEARGGNSNMLRVLDLESGYGSHIELAQIAILAKSCPELEVFKIQMLLGLPTKMYPAKYNRDPIVFEPLSEHFLSQPLQVLPRLKTFHVQQMIKYYSLQYFNSDSVQRLLPWLFAGMPVLEDLILGFCPMPMTIKERKRFRSPRVPSLGRALSTLPSSIKELTLKCVNIGEKTEFVETLTPPSRFPNLQHLHLQESGAEMLPVVLELKTRYYDHLTIGIRPGTAYYSFPLCEGNSGVRLSNRITQIQDQRTGFQIFT